MNSQTANYTIDLEHVSNLVEFLIYPKCVCFNNYTSETEEPDASSGASLPGLTREQQRQNMKTGRREYNAAVCHTATIVGFFVVLWLPGALGRVLASSAGYNSVIVNSTFCWLAVQLVRPTSLSRGSFTRPRARATGAPIDRR